LLENPRLLVIEPLERRIAEIHRLADLERSTAGSEQMLRDKLDRRVELAARSSV
jgi:hypothetical protein